jgi:hypothetical protein
MRHKLFMCHCYLFTFKCRCSHVQINGGHTNKEINSIFIIYTFGYNMPLGENWIY